MIAFTHMVALMVFIALGALGMAALQDGGTIIWKRLRPLFGFQGKTRSPRNKPMLSPLTFSR